MTQNKKQFNDRPNKPYAQPSNAKDTNPLRGKKRLTQLLALIVVAITLLGYFSWFTYPKQSFEAIDGATPEIKPFVQMSNPVQVWEIAEYDKYQSRQTTRDNLAAELANHWGTSVYARDVDAWMGRMKIYTNSLDLFGYLIYIPVPGWLKLAWEPFGEIGALLAIATYIALRKVAGENPGIEKVHCLILFLFFLIVYLTTISAHTTITGDQYTYVAMTRHLVEDHSLILTEDRGPAHISLGADGNYYPKYPPGFPLLAAPLFILYGTSGCYFLSAIVSAGVIPILYKLCRLCGSSQNAALLTGEIYGISSLNWVYARTTFVEGLLTFLAIAGVYLVVLSAVKANYGLSALAGVPIGYIALVKTVMVVICLPLIVYLLAKRRLKNCAAFICILALFAGSLMLYNAKIYGDPLISGYQVNAGSIWNPVLPPFNELEPPYGWSVPFYIGLKGLLVDVQHGLFTFSPILLLAIAGFPYMRRQRLEAPLLFFAFLSVVLLNMSWWCWDGGLSFGARLIHPFDVFLAVPLATLLHRHGGNPAVRAVTTFLFAVSFVFIATGALTQNLWT